MIKQIKKILGITKTAKIVFGIPASKAPYFKEYFILESFRLVNDIENQTFKIEFEVRSTGRTRMYTIIDQDKIHEIMYYFVWFAAYRSYRDMVHTDNEYKKSIESLVYNPSYYTWCEVQTLRVNTNNFMLNYVISGYSQYKRTRVTNLNEDHIHSKINFSVLENIIDTQSYKVKA